MPIISSPSGLLTSQPIAVIDIGSNSMRMVVYHALCRVPMPLFNEKYFCGLAQDLAATGKLNPEGVKLTKQAVARFMLMLERFGIVQAQVIATAAIRDAKDGAKLVRDLEEAFGITVQVIDGERESRLAALGVLSAMWQPSGLCADLGGGSLELSQIDEHGQIHHACSLPLGALRLRDQFAPNDPALRRHIRTALAPLDWLKDTTFERCYAVGGSLRSVAKTHARQSQYPLKLVHEYQMKKARISELAEQLTALSPRQRDALPGISDGRGDHAAIAAIVLDELMRHAGCKQATFSVAGIREGIIHEQLPAAERQRDPLHASAEVLATIAGRGHGYATELFAWMQPLFKHESSEEARLRRALCQIGEIAWTIDPNFRAEWAYLRVMQSDMKGMNHPQRVMLALALYHRYQMKWKAHHRQVELLSKSQRIWAQRVGLAANLAFQLSGGQPDHLKHSQLYLDKSSAPKLKLDASAKPLYTEIVAKRLEGLSGALIALSSSSR